MPFTANQNVKYECFHSLFQVFHVFAGCVYACIALYAFRYIAHVLHMWRSKWQIAKKWYDERNARFCQFIYETHRKHILSITANWMMVPSYCGAQGWTCTWKRRSKHGIWTWYHHPWKWRISSVWFGNAFPHLLQSNPAAPWLRTWCSFNETLYRYDFSHCSHLKLLRCKRNGIHTQQYIWLG